jgi:hypothetical protein
MAEEMITSISKRDCGRFSGGRCTWEERTYGDKDEREEIRVVAPADAVVHPLAVMVAPVHAVVAHLAVARAWRAVRSTRRAVLDTDTAQHLRQPRPGTNRAEGHVLAGAHFDVAWVR